MAYIDPNARPAQATAGRSASATGQQRDGWLLALESSCWQEILSNMHNSPGAPPFTSKQGRDENAAPEASHLSVGERESEQRGGAAQTVAAKSPVGTYVPGAPSAPSSAPPSDDEIAYVGASNVQSQRSIEEQDVSESGAARRAVNAAERDQISAQKVLVLPNGDDGVEVWVRNADMTSVQMQMLLCDIRRNVRSQGSELTKLSLNGREIYADNQERVQSMSAKGN